MSQNQASNMEVDHDHDSQPGTSTQSGGGTLKRSNSAPMINMMVTSTQAEEVNPSSSFKSADASRLRRLSSSNMGIHAATTSSGALHTPKPTDRVNQIKHEENNITDRETAHEKEVHHSWQVTHSWDVLTLNNPETMMPEAHRRPRSFSESLHILTSPSLLSGSPSPTRIAKQCFSPSMRAPVKDTTFTPSPSPSPTRKSFIRSLSPIATQAPLKRKLESDGGDRYEYLSPPKKFHTGPSTPDRNLPHPLAQSISSSSLEESSPEQTVPRSCLPPPSVSLSHPVSLPHPHPHHPHPQQQQQQQMHRGQQPAQPQPVFVQMGELTDIHMADSNDSFPAQFTPIHPDRV